MWNIIEYLKDPFLVVRVQRFYGIYGVKPTKHEDHSASYVNSSSKYKEKDIRASKLQNKVNCDNGYLRQNKKRAREQEDETLSSESDCENNSFVITNWFWYYFFVFGTELGDEVFYATFIPFWFWNVDGAVGRRVVMVWAIVMYIGQGVKDIVCWPRPASPPVYRLQKKWAQEYGMPSTHAMVGVAIPFSVVLYTMNRYQYPLHWGLVIAVSWCMVMCISRIYLGMHSVLDIVAGLILALGLMIPVVPMVDRIDRSILTSHWSPATLIVISILLIIFYPKGKGDWTPTRGDTTVILSVCVGVLIGSWTNYQLGEMSEPTSPPPYNVIWPSYEMIGLSALRTVIGLCCIVATRALCKSLSYAATCFILRLKSIESKDFSDPRIIQVKNSVDLYHKYITYLIIGFNIVFLLPAVFRLLKIERPTFYTEI